MLFKRTEKALQNEAADVDLDVKYQQILKKQKHRKRLKEASLLIVILLVSIGGLKSLFTDEKEIAYEKAINHYAFAKEYVSNYFNYPQTKENENYLQLFTVNGTNRSEYDLNKVKAAEIIDVDVYFVDEHDIGTKEYYMKADLEVTDTSDKKTVQELSLKLTAANIGKTFAVSEPLQMTYVQAQGMNDEDKAAFVKHKEAEGSDCSDEEKEELQNTIRLFLKTYVSDYEQARLLMNDADGLDPVDSGTVLTPENFQSIRKTETQFIIDVNVAIVTNKTITQHREYRFIIDKNTNKILDMEEY